VLGAKNDICIYKPRYAITIIYCSEPFPSRKIHKMCNTLQQYEHFIKNSSAKQRGVYFL
jgi:hypothetical protein